MGRSRGRQQPLRDGRRERSVQTRRVIIEAYLELLQAATRIPTAAEIAAKAGRSPRLVFERFNDLLALSVAAIDHVLEQAGTEPRPHDLDGDRQTRLRSHVEVRAQVCERWLPIWRALIRHQYESEHLRGRVSRVYDMIVERLKLMYRPELESLPEAERRHLLIALEAPRLGAACASAMACRSRLPARYGSRPSTACCRPRRPRKFDSGTQFGGHLVTPPNRRPSKSLYESLRASNVRRQRP